MTILSHEQIVELEGEKWKPMSREEVEAAIDAEPCNTRMRRYHRCQKYYEWELEEGRFLSVIFLDSKELTGFLTDDYDARTIRDVAERMVTGGHTFQSLIEEHRLKWYGDCLEIERDGFDYAKFGTIWLRGATDFERGKSPPGKYHIHEGAHRSLVLVKLLRAGKIEYQPVKAILIKTTGSREPDEICD